MCLDHGRTEAGLTCHNRLGKMFSYKTPENFLHLQFVWPIHSRKFALAKPFDKFRQILTISSTSFCTAVGAQASTKIKDQPRHHKTRCNCPQLALGTFLSTEYTFFSLFYAEKTLLGSELAMVFGVSRGFTKNQKDMLAQVHFYHHIFACDSSLPHSFLPLVYLIFFNLLFIFVFSYHCHHDPTYAILRLIPPRPP